MTWTDYVQEQPAVAGVYEWQLPSVACPSLVIQCYAPVVPFHDLVRDTRKLVAPFKYWTGWHLVFPKGLMWRRVDNPPALKSHEEIITQLDSIVLAACPFCKKVPQFHGHQSGYSGGIVCGASPEAWDTWAIRCCGWFNKYNYYSDPRKLALAWNDALKGCR